MQNLIKVGEMNFPTPSPHPFFFNIDRMAISAALSTLILWIADYTVWKPYICCFYLCIFFVSTYNSKKLVCMCMRGSITAPSGKERYA